MAWNVVTSHCFSGTRTRLVALPPGDWVTEVPQWLEQLKNFKTIACKHTISFKQTRFDVWKKEKRPVMPVSSQKHANNICKQFCNTYKIHIFLIIHKVDCVWRFQICVFIVLLFYKVKKVAKRTVIIFSFFNFTHISPGINFANNNKRTICINMGSRPKRLTYSVNHQVQYFVLLKRR